MRCNCAPIAYIRAVGGSDSIGAELYQQMLVFFLRLRQCFTRYTARFVGEVGTTRRGARDSLQTLRQCGDAAAQTLLARDHSAVASGKCDAGAREKLQHLTRSQPLTRGEGGPHVAALALDERELRVRLPFVGEKNRSPLGAGKEACDALDIHNRGTQLHRRFSRRASIVKRLTKCRMQLPGNGRRTARFYQGEPSSILGFRSEGRSNAELDIA